MVELTAQLQLDGITTAGAAADIRDSEALANAIHKLAAELGPAEVLEYSPLPAPEFMKPVLETTAIAGRIAPGADNDPDDVAEVLWTHHVDRRVFQTRLGMP